MPPTSPANTAMIPSPTQPDRLVNPAWVELETPVSHIQDTSAGLVLMGANSPQKPAEMHAPVTVAARKPADDFLAANGSLKIGRCEGRGGVLDPHRRPIVDAAVSAQDSLGIAFSTQPFPWLCILT